MSYENPEQVFHEGTLSYIENACADVRDNLDTNGFMLYDRHFYSRDDRISIPVSCARIASYIGEVSDVDLEAVFSGIFIGSVIVELAGIGFEDYKFSLANFVTENTEPDLVIERFRALASSTTVASLDSFIPVPGDIDVDVFDYMIAVSFAFAVGVIADQNPLVLQERSEMLKYVEDNSRILLS